MNQSTPPSTIYPLQCRWVPGTLDKVRISDAVVHQDMILELQDFLEFASRDAVNALHMKGLAQLECNQKQWDVLSALAVSPWNDSALYF
jgi:hypothetical protein